MEIRFVNSTDSQAILDIYAYYVENTVYTFEYDVPSLTEFGERIEKISKDMPYLVAIENNEVIGYAYASKYRGRAAYQWDVELSIYLRQGIGGRGVGTMLYAQLLDMLKDLRYQRAYACITVPNPASISFHRKFNFKEIGVFHKCGYKNKQWLDVMWMEIFLRNDSHPNSVESVKTLTNKE